MAIGKMSADTLNHMNVDQLLDITKGARAVKDVGGHTNLRFKDATGHEGKIRMSLVADKFAALGKGLDPEDAKSYAQLGERLQNLEAKAPATEKSGVLNKIVTGLRTAFQSVFGAGKRGGRMEMYGRSGEIKQREMIQEATRGVGPKPGKIDKKAFEEKIIPNAGLHVQREMQRLLKSAGIMENPNDILPYVQNVRIPDLPTVEANLGKLKTVLSGFFSDKKLDLSPMKEQAISAFVKQLASPDFNPSEMTFKETSKKGHVTLEKEIGVSKHADQIDSIVKLRDSAFKNFEPAGLQKIYDLRGVELKDTLNILEKNLKTLVSHVHNTGGVLGTRSYKYIDMENISDDRKQKIMQRLLEKNFKPEELKLHNPGWGSDLRIG